MSTAPRFYIYDVLYALALMGYGLSGLCKLLLPAVGATRGWILMIIGLDRIGKGIRGEPRDALISLNARNSTLATAFSVHRALDACAALLGPIIAFILLAQLPGAFGMVWVTSFVFAVLGISVLWLFVPGSHSEVAATARSNRSHLDWSAWRSRRFLALAASGSLLAAAGFLPLFYVLTAAAYMLAAIPVGRLADRSGRTRVFLGGTSFSPSST